MEISGVASVGTITVICYLIAQAVKASPINNKWIPVGCLVSGGILGIPGMYMIADFPASDMMTAIAVGIVSGGAATCINQAYWQLKNSSKNADK